MSMDVAAALGRFGLKAFRTGQREVIEAVVAGRDVLCVMPTGGGKSLCYQLPALLLEGLTLVVSPLIALMKDQEDQLVRLGIRATALHGGLEPEEQHDRLRRIESGEFDLVYVAPERLRSTRFQAVMARVRVARLAVDEAHCISEWGHDFRPDYARLGWFRHQLGDPPTIALTATATDVVRRDVASQLCLNDPAVFIRGFDRPNLWYGVTQASSKAKKNERLAQVLEETPGSIIVYAASRKNCDELGQYLPTRTGRRVVVYHAGLAPDERHRAQDAFMSGAAPIVVATNAFGMGVDKADVRAVIHHSIPGTIEAYYQEAGRAGRDGQPARCEILFSLADRYVQQFFIDAEYPDRKLVYALLALLRDQPDDLVSLTRAELKERLASDVSEMAIGAALKLLEGAGAIERINSRANMAIVRIHETGPDLTDLVPASATAQRKALAFLTGMVGDRRGEDVYFHPEKAAASLGMDRSSLVSAIGYLARRIKLDYIPPFRGSATRVIDRLTPAESLDIDFAALEERRANEYEKLDRVMRYAQLAHCRRAQILEYFGESAEPCGNCDICGSDGKGRVSHGASRAPSVSRDQAQRVLEAAGDLRGRLGKTLLAQALTGSNSQKVKRFGLQRRPWFGALEGARQSDLVALIDRLLGLGLLEVSGEAMRPTISLSAAGAAVVGGKAAWPAEFATPDAATKQAAQMVPAPSPGPAPTPPAPKGAVEKSSPATAMDRQVERSLDDEADGEPWIDEQETAPWTEEETPAEYIWTYRLLKANFDVGECCAIRRLPAGTILDHALLAARAGRRIPLAPFIRFPFPRDAASRLAELRALLEPASAAK